MVYSDSALRKFLKTLYLKGYDVCYISSRLCIPEEQIIMWSCGLAFPAPLIFSQLKALRFLRSKKRYACEY